MFKILDEANGEVHRPIRDDFFYWMIKTHTPKHKARVPGTMRPGRVQNVGHGYCKSPNKWAAKWHRSEPGK